MDKFFKNLKDGDKNKKKPAFQNPLARVGKGNRKFGGEGQSLGGSRPGKLIPMKLEEPGSLGLKIEKRPNSQGTAIVALVVPKSQAEAAGLQRGDILCHAGSDGEEEIMYDQFLAMAASDQRPLIFDVRRITAKSSSSEQTTSSAESFSRKQAVIAAAEAREKANKKWNKPVAKKESSGALQPKKDTVESTKKGSSEPMSEEAKRAIEASKNYESKLTEELGYNPYEVAKAGAGQGRNATTTIQHGAMGGSDTRKGDETGPGKATPPSDVAMPVNEEFEDALTTMVTTNDDAVVKSSLSILRKLIINATTKGQATDDDEAAAKFRRVRLSNEKIIAAISNVHGALDVMMSVGFQLFEEDGESFLVYPAGDKGPEWLPAALSQMQKMAE